MIINPNPMNRVRRTLPKRRVRDGRASKTAIATVIEEIRQGHTTIAQGARVCGCNPARLGRRVWKETKADVLARDRRRCVICGSPNQLDAHHRYAKGAGGTSDPLIAFGMANLITLCRTHHCWVEQNPDRARDSGLRLDAGEIPSEISVQYFGRWMRLTDGGDVSPAPSTGGGA